MGSTYQIDKLMISVEARTDGYERGLTRVENRTRITERATRNLGRSIDDSEDSAKKLGHTLEGLGGAPGIATATVTLAAYNRGLREAGERAAWFAAKQVAIRAAIASGNAALTTAGTAAVLAGPLIITGTAAALAAKWLIDAGSAADELDKKLHKVQETSRAGLLKQQTAGDAYAGLKVEIGRSVNDAGLKTVKKEWQSFSNDMALWWNNSTLTRDWLNRFADDVARRSDDEGEKYRQRVANLDPATATNNGAREMDRRGLSHAAALDRAHTAEGNRKSVFAEVRAAQAAADEAELAVQEKFFHVAGVFGDVAQVAAVAAAQEARLQADWQTVHDAVTKRLYEVQGIVTQAKEAAALAGKTDKEKYLAGRKGNFDTPQQSADLAAAFDMRRAAAATDSLAAQNRQLEITIATFGMTAAAAARYRAEQEGATAATIADNEARTKQLEKLEATKRAQDKATEATASAWSALRDSAAETIRSTQTPLENYLDRLDKIKQLQANGLLSEAGAERANKAAKDQFSSQAQDAFGARPAALLQGTAEAFRASFGSAAKSSPDEKALAAAREQLAVNRDALKELREMKAKIAAPVGLD